MGQTAAQIESLIEQQRDRLDCDVRQLQRQLSSMVDWRVQLRRHPWPSAVVAFAVGYLLGARLGSLLNALRQD
jgi:ElaB/YqjD/DUF883 family membrane-anchored ribosome-binding protein